MPALDQGLVVCGVFLDQRKFFDSLNHICGSVRKALQLWVCVTELKWFQNYLTDRFQ